jgi:hypothetical protein
MFEIKEISVARAANDESVQLAKWVCSVELDDAFKVLIDGASAHNVNDEEDWFSDATIRYPADTKACDVHLLDLVGNDVENECAIRVGWEIQARLMNGSISLMPKRV